MQRTWFRRGRTRRARSPGPCRQYLANLLNMSLGGVHRDSDGMTQRAESRPPRAVLGSAYWRVWWANAISSVGDGAFVSALPLLAVTVTRSEEHTSELQSHSFISYAVFCLKKKK